MPCPDCDGKGWVSVWSPDGDDQGPCAACDGTGLAEKALAQKIDARYRLAQHIEALQRELDELSHEIACTLLKAGQKQAYGTTGIGYSLMSTTRYHYGPAAYRYLETKGLLDQFVGAPKITKTKLEALIKEGVLTYSDLAELEPHTVVEQSPYTLKKIAQERIA